MICRKPDGTTVTREEFDEKLSHIPAPDRRIIDGSYEKP